jgi:hypothetical protein
VQAAVYREQGMERDEEGTGGLDHLSERLIGFLESHEKKFS